MKNEMKYLKRLNDHYNRGLLHGQRGVSKPGLIFGAFRRQYWEGWHQGSKLKSVTKK